MRGAVGWCWVPAAGGATVRGDSQSATVQGGWDRVSKDSGNAGTGTVQGGSQQGALEYARINKLRDMGYQEVYEVTTKSGKVIKATADHPFLTLNNETYNN